MAGGGTLTHHHAIGTEHRPWLAAEDGELGVELLRALAQRCDPAGIMNPGKLLPGLTGRATAARDVGRVAARRAFTTIVVAKARLA